MLFVSIYYALISFIFIFVVHYLYEYFKENLTIPKEKDMIEKPRETYNKIYETLQNSNRQVTKSNTQMKDELKNFLKELKKNSKGTSSPKNNNTGLDSFNMESSSVGFSDFSIGSNNNNAHKEPTSIEPFSSY